MQDEITPQEPDNPVVETVPETGNVEVQQDSQNPAWNDFLKDIPTDMHPIVTPKLREWDQKVQQGFQKVHSEYAPWKPVIEAGDPETVQYAMAVLDALNNDPKSVYESLAQYYGFSQESEQGQSEQQTSYYDEDESDPRIAQLQQGFETIASMLIQERQQQAEQQADQQLATHMENLRKTYGEFDENFVLSQMLHGKSSQDAVKAYQDLQNNILTKHNRPNAPVILGGGNSGSVPSNEVDVTKMSDKETRDFVTRYLEHVAKQGQG